MVINLTPLKKLPEYQKGNFDIASIGDNMSYEQVQSCLMIKEKLKRILEHRLGIRYEKLQPVYDNGIFCKENDLFNSSVDCDFRPYKIFKTDKFDAPGNYSGYGCYNDDIPNILNVMFEFLFNVEEYAANHTREELLSYVRDYVYDAYSGEDIITDNDIDYDDEESYNEAYEDGLKLITDLLMGANRALNLDKGDIKAAKKLLDEFEGLSYFANKMQDLLFNTPLSLEDIVLNINKFVSISEADENVPVAVISMSSKLVYEYIHDFRLNVPEAEREIIDRAIEIIDHPYNDEYGYFVSDYENCHTIVTFVQGADSINEGLPCRVVPHENENIFYMTAVEMLDKFLPILKEKYGSIAA